MDFRLKVFFTVANRLSFTKAAAELYISQPAVSKHIQELEDAYNTKLFDRNGSSITLTPAGQLLAKHTQAIFDIYRAIEYDMSSFDGSRKGQLRLGTSTTISNYIIAPFLAYFHQKEEGISIQLLNGNTEIIETALLNKEIEVGIVEGFSKNSAIKYVPFLKDELVLVCKASHPMASVGEISLDELKKMRLVTRERGSGTLEVLDFSLKERGLKIADFNVEMQLGNTGSIKSYLLNSNCFAFLSIHSIINELKNNELVVLDVKDLSIVRHFYLILLMGKSDSLSELFVREVLRYYNLKL